MSPRNNRSIASPRTALLTALAVTAGAAALSATWGGSADASPLTVAPKAAGDVMTREKQSSLTPQDVLRELREGNQRFVEGRSTPQDYLEQARLTEEQGQYPKAVVLGCLDSRVPPEILFDQGIGDLFVGRIAGNFENTDMLGSLEFATRAAGAKAIVVLGHTRCGAIKGAADGVELGHLTRKLDNFEEALARAKAVVEGEYRSSNSEFIQKAVEKNVRVTVADILQRSEVIADMVENGELVVAGGVYQLGTGAVDWLDL